MHAGPAGPLLSLLEPWRKLLHHTKVNLHEIQDLGLLKDIGFGASKDYFCWVQKYPTSIYIT